MGATSTYRFAAVNGNERVNVDALVNGFACP
jgi:hypothetical protein